MKHFTDISDFNRNQLDALIKKGNILGKLGKYVLWKSENQKFANPGNLSCPLFEILKFIIPDFC